MSSGLLFKGLGISFFLLSQDSGVVGTIFKAQDSQYISCNKRFYWQRERGDLGEPTLNRADAVLRMHNDDRYIFPSS